MLIQGRGSEINSILADPDQVPAAFVIEPITLIVKLPTKGGFDQVIVFELILIKDVS